MRLWINSLTGLWALPPSAHSLHRCRPEHQLNVKWMCTCFLRADRPCSQPWASLVHRAHRHRLKSQGLAVSGAQGEDCLRGMSNSSRYTVSHVTDSEEDFIQKPFSSAVAQISLSLFFRSLFRCYYFLPLKLLWDCFCLSLRIFFHPPHNRACCSHPAVNCQELNTDARRFCDAKTQSAGR